MKENRNKIEKLHADIFSTGAAVMLLVYAIIIGPVHSQLRWAFLLNRLFKDWLSTGLDLFIMCLCLRNIFLHPVS
jgi:type IV secretory pathway TrbL component